MMAQFAPNCISAHTDVWDYSCGCRCYILSRLRMILNFPPCCYKFSGIIMVGNCICLPKSYFSIHEWPIMHCQLYDFHMGITGMIWFLIGWLDLIRMDIYYIGTGIWSWNLIWLSDLTVCEWSYHIYIYPVLRQFC